MSYNWDLIQYLLHEVQHSANENFKPRLAAEAFALAQEDAASRCRTWTTCAPRRPTTKICC